ncbi:MAG: thioredoxin domain-containing protein [Bacteroidota bacterium]
MKPNRLLNEKSPYLLQHAYNPVDWYPWGEEAFGKARSEGKPIFLSIGYSTCYWCHVMEREVFENQAIAEVMNRAVVSIKVDREERPDVDRVYMSALQAMTGSGGWPMSMFLTPDLKPFFGATYIPPLSAHGRAGFTEILERVQEVWTSDRKSILETGERLTAYLRELSSPVSSSVNVDAQTLDRGFEAFSGSYDTKHAGFGHAPKFPRPVAFNFLLRYYKRAGNKQALAMSLETLRNMHHGGMYDHVGGGFHRYATDAEWHVPHFEKMLYDQAQLVVSYLEAYQITGEEFYAEVARDVLTYVVREMTHPDGGFYSAQDAESALSHEQPKRKKEGAFYTWTQKELGEALSPDELKVVELYYGVEERGNVRADPHNEFAGLNILHVVKSRDALAEELHMSLEAIGKLLSTSRSKLLHVRSKRPLPHLDDKILVSWNGLMISAFAKASGVLDRSDYLRAAERSASFLLTTMHIAGDLKRRFRDGEARFSASLEDYAFLTQGLIDLYEASLDIRWLEKAIELTESMVRLFYDHTNGGFYDTDNSDSAILVRTKESYDGAEPSGNSVAVLCLLRLAQMSGNRKYGHCAEKSFRYFSEKMVRAPEALAQFLADLDFHLVKPAQIVIAGQRDGTDTAALIKEVHARFIPNKVILLADDGRGRAVLESFLPFIKSIVMVGGRATAYVCEDYTCQLPTTDPRALADILDRTNRRNSG